MKHAQRIHFLILVVLLLGGVATFFSVTGDRTLQVITGVLTATAYVTWGIMHHSLQGDLHPRVVVEYILIGAMAVVAIVTIAR